MANRKPMLTPEEMAFIKGGDTKDNGFKKPAEDTQPIASPPTTKDSPTSNLVQSIESLVEKKETTVRFTVDLPKSMHKALSILAAEKGVKMTQLARMSIANTLAQLKEEEED